MQTTTNKGTFMISLSDFERPFECTDVYEREQYTLEYVEFSDDEELLGSDVTLIGYVFYPNNLSKSLFRIKTKDQEGAVNLGALEFLLTRDEYEDFLGGLLDVCMDFSVEEPRRSNYIKYVWSTEEIEKTDGLLYDPEYRDL
jgi:hypothetical protein